LIGVGNGVSQRVCVGAVARVSRDPAVEHNVRVFAAQRPVGVVLLHNVSDILAAKILEGRRDDRRNLVASMSSAVDHGGIGDEGDAAVALTVVVLHSWNVRKVDRIWIRTERITASVSGAVVEWEGNVEGTTRRSNVGQRSHLVGRSFGISASGVLEAHVWRRWGLRALIVDIRVGLRGADGVRT
jgi:hypothetical protein